MAQQPRLQVVAHRAGNDLSDLRAAEAAGADIVETDVYVFRGRIEVRHARTLGPWWSRRFEVDGRRPRLIPADDPRPQLGDVLAAARPDTLLMLDIKGIGRGGGPAPTPRAVRPSARRLQHSIRAAAPTGAQWAAAVGARIADAWDALAPGRPLIVSAEAWPALGPFLAARPGSRPQPRPGTTVVLSAGTARQAAVVADRARTLDGAAIGLPARLLSRERAGALREAVDQLFCWGLTSREQVRQARDWGVTHVILDDLGVAAGLR